MRSMPLQIKPASQEDRKYVVEAFLNLLEYLDEFGHDIPPYRENAEWLVDQVFLPAAARGEPVLLAWEGQTLVGALFWVIPAGPPRMRYKQAVGYGTYVDPDYRNRGVAKQLWAQGVELLRAQQVEILVGTVYKGNKGAMQFVKGPGVDMSTCLVRINLKQFQVEPRAEVDSSAKNSA